MGRRLVALIIGLVVAVGRVDAMQQHFGSSSYGPQSWPLQQGQVFLCQPGSRAQDQLLPCSGASSSTSMSLPPTPSVGTVISRWSCAQEPFHLMSLRNTKSHVDTFRQSRGLMPTFNVYEKDVLPIFLDQNNKEIWWPYFMADSIVNGILRQAYSVRPGVISDEQSCYAKFVIGLKADYPLFSDYSLDNFVKIKNMMLQEPVYFACAYLHALGFDKQLIQNEYDKIIRQDQR